MKRNQKPQRLSHEQRRDRRQRMAEAVRGGELPANVAQRFRVGLSSVRTACVEFGVHLPSRDSILSVPATTAA